jgi:hypothetical protein
VCTTSEAHPLLAGDGIESHAKWNLTHVNWMKTTGRLMLFAIHRLRQKTSPTQSLGRMQTSGSDTSCSERFSLQSPSHRKSRFTWNESDFSPLLPAHRRVSHLRSRRSRRGWTVPLRSIRKPRPRVLEAERVFGRITTEVEPSLSRPGESLLLRGYPDVRMTGKSGISKRKSRATCIPELVGSVTSATRRSI